MSQRSLSTTSLGNIFYEAIRVAETPLTFAIDGSNIPSNFFFDLPIRGTTGIVGRELKYLSYDDAVRLEKLLDHESRMLMSLAKKLDH